MGETRNGDGMNLTKTQLTEKIKDLLVLQLGINRGAEELDNPESTMADLGAVDGLDLIELVMAAEEELDIEIEDYDICDLDAELMKVTVAAFTKDVEDALAKAGKPVMEDANAQA